MQQNSNLNDPFLFEKLNLKDPSSRQIPKTSWKPVHGFIAHVHLLFPLKTGHYLGSKIKVLNIY